MLNPTHLNNDTIVALATPPGIGSIAVIRVSGTNAFEVVGKLVRGKNLQQQASHTAHFVKLHGAQGVLDEVLLTLFKNPKSYTGEDVIEIGCHGSPFIQQQILAALLQVGARMANPGEFTKRAFLSGKLDLSQAEAVADLIAAQSAGAHDLALRQLRGGYSDDMKQLRDQLIWFASLIELELDFSQEDVEFADRTQLVNLMATIRQALNQLLHSFQLGNVLKNGVSVAIIGNPNAGKSTLLNELLQENRAIVSEIAGTTRDTIEELINIKGILFRLIDTAGLRTTDDTIEQIGVSRSFEKIQSAHIILYMYDVNELNESELEQHLQALPNSAAKRIIVANKADLTQEEAFGATNLTTTGAIQIAISALQGKGIAELKELLYQSSVAANFQAEGTIISNMRHVESLQQTAAAIAEVEAGMAIDLHGDLLAAHIRQALYHLGTITGEITNEDLLDTIFKKFCIGK